MGFEEVADADIDALNTEQCLAMLQDCEKVRRRLPALEHRLINHLARQATPAELGGTLSHAIADATLISRLSAEFRIPVTENTSRAETMYSLANSEFARARQIDSQQDTPGRIEAFSLIDARN